MSKNEFITKKSDEKLLNTGNLKNNPGTSTQPVKMATFTKPSGKMFRGNQMNPANARAK